MSEETEQSGVTNEQVAVAPQSHEAPVDPTPMVANDQAINWQRANETMAQQQKRLEELAQQNQLLQQQQAIMQANTMQQSQQPAQAQDPFASLADDDVLTAADYKRLRESDRREFQQELNRTQSELKQINMRSQYPDYQEVVQYTLRQANNDPALANAIASSSDPQLLAYQIGKASPEYIQAQQEKKQSADARRIVENSRKPGAVSSAASGNGALSKADWFLSCSDQDFEKHIAKIKGGHNI